MIIAPRRGEAVTLAGIPGTRFAVFMEDLETTVNRLTANTDEWVTVNVTTDRGFDANQAAGDITATPTQDEVENIRDAVLELADNVGTLIADLKSSGVIP